jgi:hypothetical protein
LEGRLVESVLIFEELVLLRRRAGIALEYSDGSLDARHQLEYGPVQYYHENYQNKSVGEPPDDIAA